MKKRIIAIVMSAACIAALCFALAGCGNQKANFVGEWECESIESQTLGSLDMETLQSMNMDIIMTVNEDGSAALDLFGQTIDCTWKDNGATTMTLTMAGEGDAVFVLSSDGKLSSDDGDTTMTFVRVSKTA